MRYLTTISPKSLGRHLFHTRCDDLEVLDTGIEGEGRVWMTSEVVSLESIVGTIARCCDFDRCFRPLRRHLKHRMARVRDALANRHLPAISLRQRDGRYYVVDGHHRLRLAWERGMTAVDAIVTCRC